MKTVQEALFSFDTVYKPKRPLCAENKNGPYKRQAREIALNYQFIETNPTCLQSLIVQDCDSPLTYFNWEKYEIPAPSWTVENLFTEHFHAVYSLKNPVVLTSAGKRPPVNLLCRVERGLQIALEADAGYTHRIMRNPLYENTATTWGTNNDTDKNQIRAYSLRELAKALSNAKLLPKYNDKAAIKATAVGRNVTLFDLTRKMAYRKIRDYWKLDYSQWLDFVTEWAQTQNIERIGNDWGTPLPKTEVKHLARSVAGWVWKKFTPETFSKIQSNRAKRKAQKTHDLLNAIIQLEGEPCKN